MNAHHGFTTVGEASEFIFGGNATFTITSQKTGKHFTYKVRQSDDGKMSFVSVLNGPDNWENYMYIGFIPSAEVKLVAGKKGHPDAPSFNALTWVFKILQGSPEAELPATVRIQHEGKCSMCNRKLTDPVSIERGVGPDCWSRRGQ